jgi:hypothetical protein
VVYDTLAVRRGADVALLADIAVQLGLPARQRGGRGKTAGIREVEIGDGAALVAGVVERLGFPARAVHGFSGNGAGRPRLGLGGAGHDVGAHDVSLGAVEAGEGRLACRAHERHLALLLVYARLGSNEVNPLLCLLVARCAEVVVAGGREDAKDVVHLLLRVPLARDGGDLGEIDLVAQLRLVLVSVYREAVGAQDNVDGLPGLQLSARTGALAWTLHTHSGLACALHHVPGLDDAVELEAAVLADRRHDAHGRTRRLDAVELGLRGRIQLHASRAHVERCGRCWRLRAFPRGGHACQLHPAWCGVCK